ncbi:MAG: glutamine--fructose-6-phosphate transaminase (isomerizing) [Sedimentisphaerales bacterium]|nr:glutamine--fructose-6-phosphate transaminase (isomerizing) [Sedimentisphaerales bacterium]MBN2842019.1 glutamine--fructose-6-phosphate transaminase (isomerizing) [Sedimentisphaerales bacterium]
MCGIVAYLGDKQAEGILVEGLKRLEYRGYDSSGAAVCNADGQLNLVRSVGRISNLAEKLDKGHLSGTAGIAHTRWATHGAPVEKNAHPHLDHTGKIAVVHNGIIENFGSLKKWLISKGATFHSDTDTEVIPNLISHFYHKEGQFESGTTNAKKLEMATRLALTELVGTYGITVICSESPDMIIAARKGSPLVLGVGDGEYIISSDAAAIVNHTSRAIYLGDNEMAVVTRDGYITSTIDNIPVASKVEKIEYTLDEIELANYKHYMEKEIFEQPDKIRACLSGRIDLNEGSIKLGGVMDHARELVQARKLNITACGTAWHAGLVAEYIMEELAMLPTEVDYASEFRYRNPIIDQNTLQVVISQSGETIDTLAALREAKNRGALCIGVVNAVGSTIARETDCGVYLHVGPEIGVASTKAFTGQVTVLTMLALFIARRRHMSQQKLHTYLDALNRIPDQMAKILEQNDYIRQTVEPYCDKENWLFLGRGYQFPVALEGALKLKEISYIHAEGMPAAEMKHGPIALITKEMPVVFIVPKCSQYDKIVSNMEEVRARGGRILAVATEGDEDIKKYAEHVFYVPDTLEELQPLLTVLPLQMLAYHAAVIRGHDVDKPRNLAKSVTVE